MAKAKKMLSAVLAALMVVLSVASYVPAQAAKAVNVPKLQMVTQPEKEYKNGDRVSLTVTSPNYGGQVEYRVMLWNGTTKKQSELWPTHKGYYYQNWKPAGSYKFTIHWPVEGMEPGAYSLTVLTRRANSKVAYDSFVKTEAFWVKNDLTVESIAPVADITVNEGEKVTLPENVTLNMSDKTTKEAKVTWAAVDTAKPGEYTVEGTVEGTDKKATVKVVVKAVDLAVDSVSAINLKEIVVKYTTAVDEVSATNINNYSTTAGTIEDAALSEDGKSVTLSIKETMTNQKEYKLSLSKVKAATGTSVASVSDKKFAVLDNTLPEIVSAKALGNKVIKLYASEPIVDATVSMFKFDGKSFYGSVTTTGNVIILKPYNNTSVLTSGEHTVTVAKIKDYAGFISLQQDIKVTVSDDKVAPKIVEVKATLETATIIFDEDIDPSTVTKTDFYWKSGTLKKYPGTPDVSGNKIVLDFSSNPLPAYETTLYIAGVADYCGNTLSDAEVKLSATVDQTRPEVIDVKVADDTKSITVKFNKIVNGADKSNYEIKDEDGKKVTIKSVTGSGKEYVIALYTALPEGVNTLSISGIADKTALKNVMLPFVTTLDEVGDTTAPTIVGVSASGQQIMVLFDEEMDLASLADPNNYLIKFQGAYRRLPSGTELNPVQNGKAIFIILPEKIDKIAITMGVNLSDIQVMNIEDISGNAMNPIIQNCPLNVATQNASTTAYDADSNITQHAVLVDGKTIKVRFNQPISNATNGAFTLTNSGKSAIDYVEADGSDVVIIGLTESLGTSTPAGFTLAINNVNDMKTVTGNAVNGGNITIKDKVAPEVADVDDLTLTGVEIELPFTEDLTAVGEEYFANDITVVRLYDNKVLNPFTHYTTKVSGNKLIITLKDSNPEESYYSVTVNGTKYIKDASGNAVVVSPTLETKTPRAK